MDTPHLIALATALATAGLRPALAAAVSPGAEDDPRVQWLREHAVALRSIDPDDADYGDLAPLRELLGDARIVQLGEQSHGDGATFFAKTRLIRFLHEEMGFDVLAFESGFYDCRKAREHFRRPGADPVVAAQQGIFAIWTQSEQVRPLLAYVAAQAHGERPLELCGFDCQFTAEAAPESLAADFERAVREADPALADGPAWSTVKELVEHLLTGVPEPTPEQRARWQESARALEGALAPREGDDPAAAGERAYWRQFTRSLWAFAEVTWAQYEDQAGRTLAEQFNPRDAQMGENMLWLARERYPDRKIIIWAATMHAVRSPHLIDSGLPDVDYTGVRPMGHHLSSALGEAVYTVGFTAYEGQAGLPWGRPWTLPPAEEGSFEALCVRAGLENAFVPMRGIAADAWLREPLSSRPLGHSPMRASWPEVLDAMVFTRVMSPSTSAPIVVEKNLDWPDLVVTIQEEWERARERYESKNPWAEKVTFATPFDAWMRNAQPSEAEIEAAEVRVEALLEGDPSPDLAWRTYAILSAMADARGERTLAHARIDRALEAYPDRRYAQPSKLSVFQHLVNQKAMMVWDDDGLDAALELACDRLAADERYHYMHDWPWMERLGFDPDSAEAKRIVQAILAAYERRAEQFPDHAEQARAYAQALRER